MTATETAPATDIGPDIETDNLTPEIAEGHNPTLAELIANHLCWTHVVAGQVIRFEAAVEDDGRYIALDVTRVEFEAADDTTMRVLLHLSDPVTVEPAAAEAGVEIGASA